jgi:hypothetical protein
LSRRQVGRTTPCTKEQARVRRQQARAFIDVAEMVLDDQDQSLTHVASALAVLAAIAAADSICGIRLGEYHRGQDHSRAVELLETVDLTDKSLPGKLLNILSSKDDAHYGPKLMSRAAVQSLTRKARNIVDAAEAM